MCMFNGEVDQCNKYKFSVKEILNFIQYVIEFDFTMYPFISRAKQNAPELNCFDSKDDEIDLMNAICSAY